MSQHGMNDAEEALQSGRRFLVGIAMFVSAFALLWAVADRILYFADVDTKGAVFETEYVEGRGFVNARRTALGNERGKREISEQGLRRNDILGPPLPNEQRILVLGDSSAYGSLLDGTGNDFPAILESLFRKAGAFATVMNGAAPGTGFNQIYSNYLWFKQKLAIDLVIIHGGWEHTLVRPYLSPAEFDAHRSAMRLFPQWPKSLDPNRNIPITQDIQSRLGANYKAPRFIVALSPKSHLARYLNNKALPALTEALSFTGAKAEGEDGATITLNAKESCQFYLGLLLKDLNASKAPVIIVRPMSALRIPYIGATTFWDDYKMEAFEFYKKDLPVLLDQIRMIDSISDLFAREGYATLVNPEMAFFGQIDKNDYATIRRLFLDHQHFSTSANALLAEYLKDELFKRGFVKKADAAKR